MTADHAIQAIDVFGFVFCAPLHTNDVIGVVCVFFYALVHDVMSLAVSFALLLVVFSICYAKLIGFGKGVQLIKGK